MMVISLGDGALPQKTEESNVHTTSSWPHPACLTNVFSGDRQTASWLKVEARFGEFSSQDIVGQERLLQRCLDAFYWWFWSLWNIVSVLSCEELSVFVRITVFVENGIQVVCVTCLQWLHQGFSQSRARQMVLCFEASPRNQPHAWTLGFLTVFRFGPGLSFLHQHWKHPRTLNLCNISIHSKLSKLTYHKQNIIYLHPSCTCLRMVFFSSLDLEAACLLLCCVCFFQTVASWGKLSTEVRLHATNPFRPRKRLQLHHCDCRCRWAEECVKKSWGRLRRFWVEWRAHTELHLACHWHEAKRAVRCTYTDPHFH